MQKHALEDIWLPLTDVDALHMVHLLDRDGDEQVSYDEFRQFVYLLPESQVRSQSPTEMHHIVCMVMAGLQG